MPQEARPSGPHDPPCIFRGQHRAVRTALWQPWQLDAFADGATLSERHGRILSGSLSGSRHGGPPLRLPGGPRDATSASRPGRWLTGLQSVSAYMTPLRTWSTVQVAGLLLTELPHLQDLTNEMPSGDLVVCKQLNTAFSCALGQGKPPSYMTCHITGAHITGY